MTIFYFCLGFTRIESLKTHLKSHCKTAKNTTHICNVCGRGFKVLYFLELHLKKHEADGNENNQQKKETVYEHVCDICNKTFKAERFLKNHLYYSHSDRTFLCTYCGKNFRKKATLDSHVKVHTGEKPYTCSICKKSFAHIGSLIQHNLLHTGEKPHRSEKRSQKPSRGHIIFSQKSSFYFLLI